MIAVLPLGPEPFQTVTVALGETRVVFDVAYNERSGLYSLSLTDEITAEPILEGAPIVLGEDMLAPYNFGLGRLIPVDQSGAMTDAGFDELGDRVLLMWASKDEAL